MKIEVGLDGMTAGAPPAGASAADSVGSIPSEGVLPLGCNCLTGGQRRHAARGRSPLFPNKNMTKRWLRLEASHALRHLGENLSARL